VHVTRVEVAAAFAKAARTGLVTEDRVAGRSGRLSEAGRTWRRVFLKLGTRIERAGMLGRQRGDQPKHRQRDVRTIAVAIQQMVLSRPLLK
jgi:hypothetical protein